MEGFVAGVIFTIMAAISFGYYHVQVNEPHIVEFNTRCEMLGGTSLEGKCYKLPVEEIPIKLKTGNLK